MNQLDQGGDERGLYLQKDLCQTAGPPFAHFSKAVESMGAPFPYHRQNFHHGSLAGVPRGYMDTTLISLVR